MSEELPPEAPPELAEETPAQAPPVPPVHRLLKCTPETRTRIVEAVRGGNYQETAANAAGIGATTYYRWLHAGKEMFEHDTGPDHPLRLFYEEVTQALGDAEERCIRVIFAAMPTSWQAAAWWLERTRPDKFALRSQVRHEGTVSIGLEEIDVLRKSMLANAVTTDGPAAPQLLPGGDDPVH
jgi:hypothetical protein